MDMEPAIQAFATESSELLEQVENSLLELETNPDDSERVNELFRAFHTIKGSSGMFGFSKVESFTHGVESLLGKVREGSQELNEDLISLFLSCRDHISMLVGNALDGNEELEQEQVQAGDVLSAQVNAHLSGSIAVSDELVAEDGKTSSGKDTQSQVETEVDGVAAAHWHISLRFQPDALRNGMDPLSFLRYLEHLGEITGLKVVDTTMPDPAEMDPESCYLGFEIAFDSESDREAIEEVFDFVQDDCDIRILPPHASLSAYRELVEQVPESEQQMAVLLVELGSICQTEAEQLFKSPGNLEPAADTATEAAAQTSVSTAKQQKPGKDTAPVSKSKQSAAQPTTASVRVDAAKLEALINQVGELVINGAGIEEHAHRIGDNALLESMEIMSRLVEDIRDTSLGLRMVQIGDTFNRFRRVVRELSKEIGKQIELCITGGDAELDKSVVEKLTDPLTHLVRNAIDHGIETSEARIAAGKPEKGTVTLNAYHDSGSIVIEISDDGGGLSKENILAKAQERGLIDSAKGLSDQDIFHLIFEPGFSTAEHITNLSGRGVGMDVVRRNIEALRGQVEVESSAGQGSVFRIRLPLTLAIIDGFQVRVGDARYVIPLDMVDECVELPREKWDMLQESDYIELRQQVLPLLRLSNLFGGNASIDSRPDIVVVRYAGQVVGLVVDQLLGEHQTVIKPLGAIFQNLRGISGATILGSGEVAMIIDVPELVLKVMNRGKPQVREMASVSEQLH